MIRVKSIYAKPLLEDGKRILVDLFWPEGLKTREAKVHDWIQELSPTYDLQRFHLNQDDWNEYKLKYQQEILSAPEKQNKLQELALDAENGTITLLYGTKDPIRNHAAVVKELLDRNDL